MQTAIPCRLLPTREQTLEPPIPPESLLVPRQLYQRRPSSPPLYEMLYRPASADRLPPRAWTSRTPAFPARIEPSFGPAAAARSLGTSSGVFMLIIDLTANPQRLGRCALQSFMNGINASRTVKACTVSRSLCCPPRIGASCACGKRW